MSRLQTFDAPGTCPTLTQGTTYFAVAERVVANEDQIAVAYTSSDAEDSGSAPGWSIADFSVHFGGTSWRTFTGDFYQIEVKAAAVPPPPLVPPPLLVPQTVLFFYTVAAGDESRAAGVAVGAADSTGDVDLNGGTITVTATDEPAPLDYTPLPHDSGQRVNWARPALVDAATSRDGRRVRLRFSETLDPEGQVPTSRFTVRVDGAAVTLTGTDVLDRTGTPSETIVTIRGRVVTLELAAPVSSATQRVTVSYADPGSGDDTDVVEDLAGNDALSFRERPVTNRLAFAPPAVEVPADWALVPEGLRGGARFRLLFLSSMGRDATSAAIEDYNEFVQNAALAGHPAIREYGGGFYAVASTADTDAVDNVGTTGAGVPVYWLGGNKLADGYDDFHDGS